MYSLLVPCSDVESQAYTILYQHVSQELLGFDETHLIIHSFAQYIHYGFSLITGLRVVNAMRRLISASLDDNLYSTDQLCLSSAHSSRISHVASAIELRGSRQPKYATARPRKSKGRRSLRAASSRPLSETSSNFLYNPDSCNPSKEQFSCSGISKCDRSCISSQDHGWNDGGRSYPSPPVSEYDDVPSSPSTKDGSSEDADRSPFPLTPAPLLTFTPTSAADDGRPRTPRGRCKITTSGYRTPSTSPDRYISNRYTPQEAHKTFRLSKPHQQLSSAEKLLRNPSATPDPFGPLNVRRVREARINSSANTGPPVVQPRTHTIGTTNVQHPPQDPLAIQNRQASAGAVWNVGGGVHETPSGPVRGISDGRGGFISSGSNAPMFTAHFFDDDAPDQDNNQLESRLAIALGIDQTCRTLDISRSPVQARSASTGSIGTKRRSSTDEPRTRWMHGQWDVEGAHLGKLTLFLFATILCTQRRFRFFQYVILTFCTSRPIKLTHVPRISDEEASEDGA